MLIVAPALGLAAFVVAITAVNMNSQAGAAHIPPRHEDVFPAALAALNASPRAIAALGSPISARPGDSTISTTLMSGSASLAFVATGPTGRGRVTVRASARYGSWHLAVVRLEPRGLPGSIDVLEAGPN